MAETFSRYDAADYLTSEEDIAAYLEAAAEDGDPVVMTAALSAIARARNMSQLARDAGLTREGLYKALSPTGNPAFATVAKIAAALGFALSFKKAEPPPAQVAAPAKHLRPEARSRKVGSSEASAGPRRRERTSRSSA